MRPGHHEAVAAALRLLINEAFEAHSGGRTSLIGERYSKQIPAHH